MQLAARAAFAENMRKKLAKKPWIADHSGLLCRIQHIFLNGKVDFGVFKLSLISRLRAGD